MPYLQPEQRKQYNEAADELALRLRQVMSASPGHLNYVISRILHGLGPLNYTDFNGIIGALEAAKLEFYRDVVGPYEEHKKNVNGGVLDG